MGMRYHADITAGRPGVPESRRIADLLLQGTSELGWKAALYDQNILQTSYSGHGQAPGLAAPGSTGPHGRGPWTLVRDGSSLVATHACLAAAVTQRLAGDFLDLVVREQYQCYAEALSNKLWEAYIVDCQGVTLRCPWSDATIACLRSSVFQTLAQAGYVENTRTLRL